MIKGLWVVFGLLIRAATCDEHTAFVKSITYDWSLARGFD